jgi:hypothetical protein
MLVCVVGNPLGNEPVAVGDGAGMLAIVLLSCSGGLGLLARLQLLRLARHHLLLQQFLVIT